MKIIVLGAGIAGLCSAYELSKRGFDVLVLEARSRIGGRVHTIREPFEQGQFAEAGAMVVPDTHSLTKKYIGEFGLSLIPSPSNSPAVYWVGGQRSVRTNEDPDCPGALQKKYLAPFIDRVAASLSSEAWPPHDLQPLDRISFYDFLIAQGVSSEEIARLRLEYIDEWGDGIASYSALSGFYDLARGRTHLLFRIEGGSDRLTSAFAARLPSIELNAAVRHVSQTADRVNVTFTANGRTQTEQCDFVVCTIPFAAFKEISIDLSHHKMNSIQELGYTSVSRVFVQVRKRFWIDQGLSGYGYTDREFMSMFHATAVQPGPAGILEAYLSGKLSQQISGLNETERIELALQWMEDLHPSIRQHVIKATSICWDNDAWAGGAYAWFKPGQMTGLLPKLGQPEGRIHFAGDHTSTLPGWMQGALESAHRVVREITEK